MDNPRWQDMPLDEDPVSASPSWDQYPLDPDPVPNGAQPIPDFDAQGVDEMPVPAAGPDPYAAERGAAGAARQPRVYENMNALDRGAAQLTSGVHSLRASVTMPSAAAEWRLLHDLDQIDAGTYQVPQARMAGDGEQPTVQAYRMAQGPQRQRIRNRLEQAFSANIEHILGQQGAAAAQPANPRNAEIRNLINAGRRGDAWRVFASDPAGIIQQAAVTSAPASAAMMAPGMGVAAMGGGRLATSLAMYLSSYGMEFGSQALENLTDALNRAGVDMTSPQGVREWVRQNPDAMREAINMAGRGANGPAIFDAITLGFGRGIVPGQGVARNAARVGTNFAAEAITEPVGAAAGQVLSHGYVHDPGSLADELFGALPQGAGTTAVSTMREAQQARAQANRSPIAPPIPPASPIPGPAVSPPPAPPPLEAAAPAAPEPPPPVSSPVAGEPPAPVPGAPAGMSPPVPGAVPSGDAGQAVPPVPPAEGVAATGISPAAPPQAGPAVAPGSEVSSGLAPEVVPPTPSPPVPLPPPVVVNPTQGLRDLLNDPRPLAQIQQEERAARERGIQAMRDVLPPGWSVVDEGGTISVLDPNGEWTAQSPTPLTDIEALRAETGQRHREGLASGLYSDAVRQGDGTRTAPVQAVNPGDVDAAAQNAQQPTPAQAEAGNYQHGHLRLHGLDIAIETERGGTRSGVGKDGQPWSVVMPHHYGRVKGTVGADGDQVDVYLGPEAEQPNASIYVVDQVDPDTGRFDEHKVMLGFGSDTMALEGYASAFNDGKGYARLGGVTHMTMPEFKAWLAKGETKKPLARDQVAENIKRIRAAKARARAEEQARKDAEAAAAAAAQAEQDAADEREGTAEMIRDVADAMGVRLMKDQEAEVARLMEEEKLSPHAAIQRVLDSEKPPEEPAPAPEPEPAPPSTKPPPEDRHNLGNEETAPEQPAEPSTSAVIRLAEMVEKAVRDGQTIRPDMLMRWGREAFGASAAEGAFDRKTAYDAMELGVNMAIRSRPDIWINRHDSADTANNVLARLEGILDRLPTQTVRSEEQQSFQQFSTPPTYASVAAYAAGVKAGDVVLEPSAGTGSLIAAASVHGAKLNANELSERRAELLRALGRDVTVTTEDAEQLHRIMAGKLSPTVVVMNPPFSQTGGRMGTKRVIETGANHIESALKLLAPGGRLVAIVGRGMAHDAPRFRSWWQKTGKAHTVQANIPIAGSVYRKYGTTFGTRLLVIDKVAPAASHAPFLPTGEMELANAITALQEIRNARRDIGAGDTAEQPPVEQGGPGSAADGASQPGEGEAAPDDAPDGGVRPGDRTGERPPGSDVGDQAGGGAPVEQPAGQGDGVAAGQPEPAEPGGSGADAGTRPESSADAGSSDGGSGGVRSEPPAGSAPAQPSLEVQVSDEEAAQADLTENVFEPYKPQRVKIPGAQPHPGPLVQSAAMASVQPPAPTYTPNIPQSLVESGGLSIAQMEAVIYAGQAHAKMLAAPEGETPRRRGFFIGDGTGVGKGREISGILLDNWNQGRTKALWISEKAPLLNDAKRDWSGIGQDPNAIFALGKTKPDAKVKGDKGILFTTYDTLKGGMMAAQKAAQSKGKTPPPKTRIDQIVEWVGADFDGVIAFDEAHNMGNAVATRGRRGMTQPSQKALAGVELQARLPNARVVYVSATGATEVTNLSYADRLGLWGYGTPFASRADFVQKVSQGGIAAMELIARDMKALGSYMARNLSYDGVEYDRLDHTLTGDQREIYDELAGMWQIVLQNIQEALNETGAQRNPRARSAAWSAFWGTHQRFFNQIITSLQMPSVIEGVKKDIEEGRSAVLQLVNTNEADTERAAAKIEDVEDLEDLDITPREQIANFLLKSFPVQAYEEYEDEEGNVRSRPVVDKEGNPVLDPDAVAMRDELIQRLGSIRVPDGPLDLILNQLGVDDVAEVSGRGRRFVVKYDPDTRTRRRMEDKRPASANLAEADAFQSGKKRVLVFSQAGGTGRSYHADNGAASKDRRRVHYLVQAGWRADAAVQGFGRTHRTNQASAPIFRLVTTDLKGQKRFISSIARRLAQLGALTKGQRQAADQGVFSAADNLESTEAKDGLRNFWRDVAARRVEDFTADDVYQEMGLRILSPEGSLLENLPEISQFLNRILSLKIDRQNMVFDAFMERVEAIVEGRRALGQLDAGIETIKADRIRKDEEQTIYADPESGAETKYVRLTEFEKRRPTQFEHIATNKVRPVIGWLRTPMGKVVGYSEGPNVTDADGSVTQTYRLIGPLTGRVVPREQVQQTRVVNNQTIRYERITKDEAERMWKAEIGAASEYVERPLHIITGAVLPIWDRLPGNPRVYRLQTDAGERMLGRVIEADQVDETLQNFGVSSGEGATALPTEPRQMMEMLTAGAGLRLSNGWRLKPSRVGGEQRIELTGPSTPAEGRQVQTDGAFSEVIQFKTRYFVPTGERGEHVLRRLTSGRQVVEVVAPPRQRPGADDIRASIPQGWGAAETATSDDITPEGATALRDILQTIAGREAALEMTQRLGAVNKGEMPDAVAWGPLVRMAYMVGQDRAGWVIRHEALHVLRNLGKITDAEWQILTEASAREGWKERFGIEGRYSATAARKAQQEEEAIVEAFAQWATGNAPAPSSAVERIFQKIRQFLVRLRNALKGRGFQDAESLFRKIERGDLGRRAGGTDTRGPGSVEKASQDMSRSGYGDADAFFASNRKRGAATRPGILDNDAFWEWFRRSAVVDRFGFPLVVYHSTRRAGFNVFYEGSHFGTKEQAEDIYQENSRVRGRLRNPEGFGVRDAVYPVYLSIQNPKRVTDQGDEAAWALAIEQAIEEGYDGLVYENTEEGNRGDDSWVAFRPEQVKSAIGNSGAFDRYSDDILASIPGDVARRGREKTEDFLRTLFGREKQNPQIHVEERAGARDLAAWERFLKTPERLFRRFPALSRLIESGMKAEQRMQTWLKSLTDDYEEIRRTLRRAKGDWAKVSDALVDADMEGVDYDDPAAIAAHLDAHELSPAERTATIATHQLLMKIGRVVDQHRRAMLPQVRARKAQVWARMKAILDGAKVDSAEYAKAYRRRAYLNGRIKAGEGDIAKQAAERDEITKKLRELRLADQDVMDRYDALREDYDALEARLAETSIRKRIKGYFPHKFYGSWRLYENTGKDDEGNDTLREITSNQGFYDSREQAIAAAKAYLAENPSANLEIKPRMVTFPAFLSGTPVSDASYRRLMARMEDEAGISGDAFRQAMKGIVRKRSRRRVLSAAMKRTGADGYAGFEEDNRGENADKVLRTHINQIVRYVVMDRMKFQFVNETERLGLSPYRREALKREGRIGLHDALEGWWRDLNGSKQPFEEQIDRWLTKAGVPGSVTGAAAAGAAIGGLAAGPLGAGALATYLGWRMSHAQRKGGEFQTRTFTGGIVGDVAHLKLGMGINIGSAAVNLTQTLINTYPVLGPRWTAEGTKRAAAAMWQQATTDKADWDGDARILQRLDIATDHRFTEEQALIRQHISTMKRISMFWFETAERMNRATAALGAYYRAIDAGRTPAQAIEEARKTLTDTQFQQGLANKPEMLRLQALRIPTQFWNFMFQQVAFAFKLGGQAKQSGDYAPVIRFYAMLFLMAGMLGLPAMGLLDWLLEKVTGERPTLLLRRWAIEEAQRSQASGTAAQVMLRGLPALAGIDISSRIGMGKGFGPNDLRDLTGPAIGSLIRWGELSRRDAPLLEQMGALSPIAEQSRNLAALARGDVERRSGIRRGAVEDRPTVTERVQSAAGFRPVGRSMEADVREFQAQVVERRRAGLDRYISRIIQADEAGQQERIGDIAREARAAGVELTQRQIVRAIQDSRRTRAERDVRRAPREVRPEIYRLHQGVREYRGAER